MQGLNQTPNKNKHMLSALSIGIKGGMFALAVAGANTHVLALETLDDQKLAAVSGQDGIAITTEMSDATIDSLTWQDGSQGSLKMGNNGNPITVAHPNGASDVVSTKITVQTASAAGNPGLNLGVSLGQADVKIPSLSVCDNAGVCTSLGALAVTNKGADTKFSIVTSSGLFSEAGTTQLKAVLDNLNVSIKQTNGGTTNQLMLGNLYANMTADGKLFVTDVDGLKFIGTVDFAKRNFAGIEREGLEVLVQHEQGTNGLQTLGKIAFTGGLSDVNLSVRGVTGTVQDLGFNNGDTGIAMRMKGNINTNSNLKIGENNGLGLTQWRKLPAADQGFDSGNVYLNIIPNGQVQTLTPNTRLTRTAAQVAAADSAVTKGRAFIKEQGDSNTTLFGTTGQQYVTKKGYVTDINGRIVRAFDGLKHNYGRGIINKAGQHVSVKDFLNDGYVTNGVIDNYNDNGTNSFDNGSNGGRFEQIIDVANGGGLYQRVLYDSASGTGNNRGNRQMYVWRAFNDGSVPADGNVVVGSFDNVNSIDTKADAWFKAVNLKTGNFIGGNNLSLASTDYPYRVNNNGEVRNQSGVLLMNNHTFNQEGFLVENPDGSWDTNNNGSSSNNGAYVYEYNYQLDNATNELVVLNKDGTEYKRIKLAVFSAKSISPTTDADYSMTTDTVNGGNTSIGLNVRGMSIQSYATDTEFFEKSGTTTRTDTQNWTVAPVIYKLDANALIFPKTLNATTSDGNYTKAGQAIGYKLVATTKGSDYTGSNYDQTGAKQTTGIFFTHDDIADPSKSRYIGLRHIDSLLRAQGDIQITGEGIAITAKDLLFAFRGEIASGRMPSGSANTFAVKDRIAVAEGKLKGNLKAKLTPKNNGVGVKARMDFADTQDTQLRLLVPETNASININQITGSVAVDGTLSTINIANNPSANYVGAINFKGNVVTSPENTPQTDLRIHNIGYNATPITGTSDRFSPYQDQRIGEVALTKHNIYTNMTIREAR